jgi:peptidoglycan/LPS O-acetylase OafA/YrhL
VGSSRRARVHGGLPGEQADPFPSRRGADLGYVPGIDGLRALAVVAVILYHAELSWIPGGFLGVEVFFVVSGFLITSLLLSEVRNDGSVALGNFWVRRARRLLPALFLVLTATSVLALLFAPGEVAELRGDVLSALFYVTNWDFVFSDKSYFEIMGRPPLLQHLWSLAVEEQFYLFWPLIFIAGMRGLGKRRFAWAIAAAALVSAAWMALLFDEGSDPSRVYYGTDTRASALLIACALAFWWSPWRLRADIAAGAKVVLNLVGFLALLAVLRILIVTDEFDPGLYRFGFAGLSLLTAVVIAVTVHPGALLGRVLGWAPLVWIGKRSYGLYLWHWPIFQVTRPDLDVPITGVPNLVLRLGLTVGAAELSYRYVEMPIRRGALGRWWTSMREAEGPQRARLQVGFGSSLVAAVVVVTMVGLGLVRAEAPDQDLIVAAGDGIPTAVEGQDPSAVSDTAIFNLGTEPAPVVPSTDAPVGEPDDSSTTVGSAPPGSTPPGSTPDTTAGSTTTAPAPPPSGPAPPPVPVTKRVAALGDSVMLGAKPQLQTALGPTSAVDAVVGRQVSDGINVLRFWQSKGLLPEVVVIHLGNNGTFTDQQFDEIMSILASVPKVIFVNDKVPRRWQDPNNAVIAGGVGRYPGRAFLLDWVAASHGRPDLFYDDGMHLRPEGAQYYSQLIASVI